MKVLFIIYADLESLLEKMSTYHNNLEKVSTIKINEYIPFGYSLIIRCPFDATKNRFDCYRGKDCMERFSKDLKEHATKIINYEKRNIIPLTYDRNKSYKKQKVCDKNNHKVRDHCHYTGKYRGAARDICNLRCKASKKKNSFSI